MSIRSERIFSAINNSRLSYGELAKITGIPKSALQRYATGETDKVPVDRIELIARATNVSAEFLMGWDSELDDKAPLTEKSPAVLEGAELLKLYFREKMGREPTEQDLLDLDRFTDTFIKGLDK